MLLSLHHFYAMRLLQLHSSWRVHRSATCIFFPRKRLLRFTSLTSLSHAWTANQISLWEFSKQKMADWYSSDFVSNLFLRIFRVLHCSMENVRLIHSVDKPSNLRTLVKQDLRELGIKAPKLKKTKRLNQSRSSSTQVNVMKDGLIFCLQKLLLWTIVVFLVNCVYRSTIKACQTTLPLSIFYIS